MPTLQTMLPSRIMYSTDLRSDVPHTSVSVLATRRTWRLATSVFEVDISQNELHAINTNKDHGKDLLAHMFHTRSFHCCISSPLASQFRADTDKEVVELAESVRAKKQFMGNARIFASCGMTAALSFERIDSVHTHHVNCMPRRRKLRELFTHSTEVRSLHTLSHV